MKVAVYADVHCLGPNAVMTPDRLIANIEADKRSGFVVVCLGDIVDIKNTGDVVAAEELLTTIMGLVDYFIAGNHELLHVNDKIITINGIPIYCHHGDVAKYGVNKAVERRAGKPGRGVFVRFLVRLGGLYRRLFPYKLNAKAVAAIEAYTPNGVNHAWSGHCHPKYLQVATMDGLAVCVYPQGRTLLEL